MCIRDSLYYDQNKEKGVRAMIRLLDATEPITPEQLKGFFVGWPAPPTPETHLRLLQQSDAVVLAVDDATQQVVGFITAISDGVLLSLIHI